MSDLVTWKLNPIHPDSPLLKVVDEVLNPPKRRKYGLRKHQISLMEKGWCSAFLERLLPQMAQAEWVFIEVPLLGRGMAGHGPSSLGGVLGQR